MKKSGDMDVVMSGEGHEKHHHVLFTFKLLG
jgi:hypothetical protein